MNFHLTGKKALLLASSQGLGLGIAAKLCEEGADVMISGRDEQKLNKASASLNGAGPGSCRYCVADLSKRDASHILFDSAVNTFGTLDILVNNVGGPPPGSVEDQDLETWRNQFEIMVIRLIELTNLSLAGMREKQWGRILTVASSSVVQPIPGLSVSNTIRSAIVGWNKSLANEIAGDGITANILAPGRIATERVRQIDALRAEKEHISVAEVRERSMASIPVGRYGTVEEFGAVGAFLVSEQASYITGTVIRCDGGLVRSV